MHEQEPPSGGRMRMSARQAQAPAGDGWDPIERCDWEAIVTALAKPWPLGAQRQDLRYWASRQRAHKGDRPGYRILAERWGITETAARLVCADVEWWADPRFGDPDPKRAQQGRSEGAARAHEGRTEGAARAHEGRTEGAPDHDADAILNVKGRSKGAARAHEGRTEGAARAQQGRTKGARRAPKDNSNSNSNSDSNRDREEQVLSAAPTQERPKSEKTKRAEEAKQLLATLDELRRMRHKGRGLSEGTWAPKLERALAKRSAQSIVDGYVWMLRSPSAAFLRGEDGRGTTDYTVDFSTCLAHPEYADRRKWKGPEAPLRSELDAWAAAVDQGQPVPDWVERWAQADRFAYARHSERLTPTPEVNDDGSPVF